MKKKSSRVFPCLIPGGTRRSFNSLTMGRLSATFSVIFIAVVSLLCGFLYALPLVGNLPSTGALASAARGLEATDSVQVPLLTGWSDSVNGWFWQSGGAARLATGQWVSALISWTVVVALVLLGVWALIHFVRLRHGRLFLLAAAVLLLLAGTPFVLAFLRDREAQITSLQLIAPVDLMVAVQTLDSHAIFANDEARAALHLFAPEVARDSPLTDPKLVNNPQAWRQALRENKWEFVLLTGPNTGYRALLSHLLISPDWHIAQVSNQGYLFRRGPGTPPPTLELETISLPSEKETALYLAQLASRLDAVHRLPEAKAAMDRALLLSPENVDVQSHAATLAAGHKKWHEAVAHASVALENDPNAAQPRIVRALAELETGQLREARDDISLILQSNPNDPYSLFLLARISRAGNDYATEADTLEHLVNLTARAGQPVIHYQIYLAQAYAKLERNKEALKTYRAVLDQGHLNPEQTTAIEESIDAIEASDAAEK